MTPAQYSGVRVASSLLSGVSPAAPRFAALVAGGERGGLGGGGGGGSGGDGGRGAVRLALERLRGQGGGRSSFSSSSSLWDPESSFPGSIQGSFRGSIAGSDAAGQLESSRHGGGEEHGSAAESGGGGERGDAGDRSGTDTDKGGSPTRNSPLRWMRRTLRAGWGRGSKEATAGVAAGRWGFRRGGARRISAGGSGEEDGPSRVSTTMEAEDAEGHGEEGAYWGFGLSGWGSEGNGLLSGRDKGLKHQWVTRQPWASRQSWGGWGGSGSEGEGGDHGGDGGGGEGAGGRQGSRPPWLDKAGWEEMFRTKGGDLHIRTVARIQTMLVRYISREREAAALLLLYDMMVEIYCTGVPRVMYTVYRRRGNFVFQRQILSQ